MCVAIYFMVSSLAHGQAENPLVGIWTADEGFQVVQLLFRSDGRYKLDTKSTDPILDFSSTEQGRYELTRAVAHLNAV
jgi:hypothetical protein